MVVDTYSAVAEDQKQTPALPGSGSVATPGVALSASNIFAGVHGRLRSAIGYPAKALWPRANSQKLF